MRTNCVRAADSPSPRASPSAMLRKVGGKISCSFNLILPDGQITSDFPKSCQAPFEKIFLFSADPNHFYIHHRLVPTRGADRASSQTRGGMRWTRQRQAMSADGR